ncbi:MAG: hypothetical protein AAGI13_04960 [Pseudomonadota bacterium]
MSLRALRWEDFSAGTEAAPVKSAAPKAETVTLPEGETLETLLAKARGKGRADGFAEGVAMAEARAEGELRMVLQAIAEQIDDSRLDRSAARSEVIDTVLSITTTLFRAIAPALAETTLMAEIRAAVAESLETVPPSQILVVAAPSQASAIAEMLEAAKIPVRVDEDPDLGSLAARIQWQGGFDEINLEDCIARALNLLTTHCEAARELAWPEAAPSDDHRRQVNE